MRACVCVCVCVRVVFVCVCEGGNCHLLTIVFGLGLLGGEMAEAKRDDNTVYSMYDHHEWNGVSELPGGNFRNKFTDAPFTAVHQAPSP